MAAATAAASVAAFAGAASAQVGASALVNVNNSLTHTGQAFTINDPVRATAEATNTYVGPTHCNGVGGLVCIQSITSVAASYADLSTGKVGASAVTLGHDAFAQASGTLRDFVTFQLANGLGQAWVPFSFDIDGAFAWGSSAWGSVNYILDIVGDTPGNEGALELQAGVSAFGDPTASPQIAFLPSGGSRADSNFQLARYGASGVAGEMLVHSGDRFQLIARLEADKDANFYHTGAFDFDLPDGVTFTSDSGVFLSAAGVSGAPEPASWALMITGFGLAGAALRRRRTAVAA